MELKLKIDKTGECLMILRQKGSTKPCRINISKTQYYKLLTGLTPEASYKNDDYTLTVFP